MVLVRACKRSDVAEGGLKLVKVGTRKLIIANVDGTFIVMDNLCTHEQADLSEGQLSGNVLTCPDHGAQFDVKTGKVLSGPDGEPADTITPEKTYTVTVQGDDIVVELP